MAKLRIIKIVRSGKLQSRVETSDGHQLVLDHGVDGVRPCIGMELDVEAVPVSRGELRRLRPGDKYPELLDGGLEV